MSHYPGHPPRLTVSELDSLRYAADLIEREYYAHARDRADAALDLRSIADRNERAGLLTNGKRP